MQLADRHGRVATDLRVSLTDRCNLRCQYCMPAEGLDWTPTEQVLTDAEVIRLIEIAVTRLGVTSVRFTGGEPLLRKGLPEIVSAANGLGARTALTTNGLGLEHLAQPLKDAGLDRVNVSLDSVDSGTYSTITRRERLPDVIAGLEAAAAVGLRPVKVNAVLLRGINDDQAPDLMQWCLDRGYELRFIEQMPLDPQHGWSRDGMVTANETLELLSASHRLTALDGRGSAPAERYLVDDGPHVIGIIGSVTRPFCGDCDRVRLTADGQVRNCLFARDESDLRSALRAGASDTDLAERWMIAMASKLPGHGIDDPTFLQPSRPMSAIGG